jgi:hypothetical protein
MGRKRCLRTTMLVFLCAVLAGLSNPTLARTIYVDDDASGLGDGSSWATAFAYLQEALAVASAADEIRVAQGVYLPDLGGGNTAGDRNATFRVPDGVTIQGGFAGVGAADPDLRDPANFATILTGDLAGDDDLNDGTTFLDNSSHVVTAQNVSSGAVLDGLTIAHGYDYDHGGNGLYNQGASLTLRDCTFLDNRSGDGHGGAIYNSAGNVCVDDSRFIRNRAGEGAGALCNAGGSTQIVNCEFIENHGGEGAGVMENSSNGDAAFFHCVFRGNSAYDGTAGIASSGELSLLYCTFVENHAQEHTGAVSCTGGNAIIAHCLFCRNRAEDTGAIHVQGASVSLDQCTFYGNVATDGWAGAVYCRPVFQWIDGTILTASLHASGCIFWANGVWRENEDDQDELMTGYADQIGGDPNGATLEYCCVQGWTPDRGGLGNIGVDPLFVAPDQNDFHLKSQAGHWDGASLAWVLDDVTSPCIDAGDPNSPVEHELFPNGGIVNMGAYGGTCEASKSWFGTEPCQTVNAADINGDCRVDAEDYRLIALRWYQPATPE